MGKTKIGIIGQGDVSPRNAVALVADYLDSLPDKTAHFVFGITDLNDPDRALEAVADWVLETDDYDLSFEVVVPDTKTSNVIVGDLLEYAERVQKAANVPATTARSCDRLFIAWHDDENGDAMKAFLAADQIDVPSFDLCEGLLPIEFAAEEPEDEGEKTPPSEPDPVQMTIDEAQIVAKAESVMRPSEVPSLEVPGVVLSAEPAVVRLHEDDIAALAAAIAEAVTAKRTAGRPRKDGTPAQPRVVDPATGKKVRADKVTDDDEDED